MNKYRTDSGKKLIELIENGLIPKDSLLILGETFHSGYEQLYYEKFNLYLGSAGRYIQNQRLKELVYD